MAMKYVVPQYTLILHAGKAMPKQCVDYLSGKTKTRRTVGVRMPGDSICQVHTHA
jgi:tRNA A37 threonylcarbamoyladenosine synthetase subunit TsaC/SUA5/YrdC